MLRLEGVEFARGGFRLAADISVPRGITAVIGPSGGGKSTLLSLIAGFEVPDRGRVMWDGRDLGPLAPGARPVAVLFQDNNLFPHLDVLANVALGLAPRTRPTSEDLSPREGGARPGGAGGVRGSKAR